jgi:streptogramin lyase
LVLLGLFLPRGLAPPATAALSTASGSSSLTWPDTYAVVQHPLPDPGSEPWEITIGPHGQVWFAEQGTNMLGEYEPTTGTMVQYPIPTPGATPDAVAADSAGNVWLSELTASKLAELPAGGSTIREFAIPGVPVSLGSTTQNLDCGPGAIVPDPSGSLWVACLFSNQIDEFFPDQGTFASFNLPVFQSAPAGLALDGRGDLWFTAADAQMLGKAVITQLVNNTSDGITESAPVNDTYPYKFTHPTSFLGTTAVVTSSLPTPSGIALDSSGRLWITEHVDSSFDSYNQNTHSFVRYWTSQTYGIYGYPVSFPNGIAVDGNGTVWVGEHYGNKVAEFVPSTGQMTEYPLPCCKSDIAGLYSVALDSTGKIWFVEINGDAIGELVKEPSPIQLGLGVAQSEFALTPQGSVTLPIQFSEASTARNSTGLTLSVSGISGTGGLENMSAAFGPAELSLTPGSQATANLTLQVGGLSPGIYYLTLSGTASPGGVVYSTILKLTVSGGGSEPTGLLIPAAVAAAGGAGFGGWVLARRSHGRTGRGRPRPRRNSLRSSSSSAARTPPMTA